MNRSGTVAAKLHWRSWLATVGVLAAVAVGGWSGVAAAGSGSAAASPAWVGTWSAAQVAADTSGLSATGFNDQTVRNIVHTSAGGSQVRLRLSNVFGAEPLTVTGVHVGLRSSGAAVAAGTDRAVTFDGAAQVTIPAGQRAVSDPVALAVGAEQDLAVSVYFAGPTGPATWHPNADSTNYYADGDHGADTSAAAYTHTSTSWYFLDGVDVLSSDVAGSVVTFGPSTTDGDASTRDANLRYPDDLARRLLELPAGQQLSVLNAGISGNQLLADGGTSGPSALSRFARDALDQTGVRAVVIWEGTNDIGNHPDLDPSQLTDAYQQLIDAAHQQGVRVIGATLQPDKGTGYYTPEGNEVRKAVNDWIRTSGAFDGVADFDQVLLDPADPDQMLPAYDSGDHLHPNDLGYQAIADSINLRLFTGPAGEPAFSGIGTADPASMTVQPGGSATDTITVRSLGDTATLPWDAGVPGGTGITVSPRSGTLHVPAGGSATVRLTVAVSATAANSTVTFNLRNPTGESALAARFAVDLDRHSPVASSSDGQYVSFANGTGSVVHDWKDGGGWHGPYALGGTARADSPVVSSADGSFVSFIDTAGDVVHDWKDADGWHGPFALGGAARAGSGLASSADGSFVSFVNASGQVVHDWKDADGWHGPYALGGTARADSPIASSADGSFVSFIDTAGDVVHDWKDADGWHGPYALGGTAKAGSGLASSADGSFVSFVNASGQVVHDWKDADGWHGPFALGGTARAGSPVVSSDDGFYVSFVDTAGNVVHDWRTSDGVWHGPYELGGIARIGSGLACGSDGLSVAFVNDTGQVVHDWRDASSGAWMGPDALGGTSH